MTCDGEYWEDPDYPALQLAREIARRRAEVECASCGRFLPDLNCPGCSFKPRDCICKWIGHKPIPDEGAQCVICGRDTHFVVLGARYGSDGEPDGWDGYWRHSPPRKDR
jgi:hypothetical protein